MSSKSCDPAQVVLAAGGEHEVDRARVRGLDGGRDPLDRERRRRRSRVVPLPLKSSTEPPASPVSIASRIVSATPAGSSAKQFSRSALTGRSVASTIDAGVLQRLVAGHVPVEPAERAGEPGARRGERLEPDRRQDLRRARVPRVREQQRRRRRGAARGTARPSPPGRRSRDQHHPADGLAALEERVRLGRVGEREGAVDDHLRAGPRRRRRRAGRSSAGPARCAISAPRNTPVSDWFDMPSTDTSNGCGSRPALPTVIARPR